PHPRDARVRRQDAPAPRVQHRDSGPPADGEPPPVRAEGDIVGAAGEGTADRPRREEAHPVVTHVPADDVGAIREVEGRAVGAGGELAGVAGMAARPGWMDMGDEPRRAGAWAGRP